MRRERWTALGRAAGWSMLALPVLGLAALLLGSAWLTVGCWVVVLVAHLTLAWTQGGAYPALGPWAAVVERRSRALWARLYAVTSTARRLMPGDGLGFVSALSGPLIVGGVLTMAAWLPWAWRAVLVGGTAVHLYGAFTRTAHPTTTDHSDSEQTRTDAVAGRWSQ